MVSSFFVAHGSPMLAIQDNAYTRRLRTLGASMPKPEAVVVFSAHWTSRTLTVSYTDGPHATMYDFGGFPDEMYTLTYPAPGSIEVADEMIRLLQAEGIEASKDVSRGLDHGAWVILRHLFPDADVPVVNVSVNPLLPPAQQYAIGAALAALKDRNVIMIGSGATVHNFRKIKFHAPEEADAWAKEFDDWLIEQMREWDTQAMFEFLQLAPHAAAATPDYEHFLPLIIAMGTGDRTKRMELLHQSYEYGSLSHLLVQFA